MTTLEEVSAKLESVENELVTVKDDLEFYKSIFMTHPNSAVFNLRIKSINGKRLWVDKVNAEHSLKIQLDPDEETVEWLQPIKCER
tara:strand:- start:514 stop:771 length:258 start_codon:yes stop_codon:yes gene_type:complete